MMQQVGCAIPVMLALVLTSCAGAGSLAQAERRYSCVPTGATLTTQATPAWRWDVSLSTSRSGDVVSLQLGKAQREVLQRVGSAPSQVYSNDRFAWRVATPVSRLTDIEAVNTFDCRPVGIAPQAGL